MRNISGSEVLLNERFATNKDIPANGEVALQFAYINSAVKTQEEYLAETEAKTAKFRAGYAARLAKRRARLISKYGAEWTEEILEEQHVISITKDMCIEIQSDLGALVTQTAEV